MPPGLARVGSFVDPQRGDLGRPTLDLDDDDGGTPTDPVTPEEAAAALTTLDSEFGRTTDPVRMYMREMGTVELLTREGEIKIAKGIEEGQAQVQHALAHYPLSIRLLLDEYAKVDTEEEKLTNIISAFIDPNAEDEIPTPAQVNAANQEVDDSEAESDEDEDDEAEEVEVVLPGSGIMNIAAFALPQIQRHVISISQHVPCDGGFYLVSRNALHCGPP